MKKTIIILCALLYAPCWLKGSLKVKFALAVQNNDSPSAIKFIQQGVNVEESYLGVYPFIKALDYNNKDIAEAIINSPTFQSNKLDISNRYPINWAILSGNVEIVKVLIQKPGIDLNLEAPGWNNYTPLVQAIEQNSAALVKVLLENPTIDINKANKNGVPPLQIASDRENEEIVKILLDNGASPFIGITELSLFAKNPTIKKLLQDAETKAKASPPANTTKPAITPQPPSTTTSVLDQQLLEKQLEQLAKALKTLA